MKKIPLIKPYINQEIKDKICEVLDSGFLTEGSVTKDLESKFQEFIGCLHAIAVCNCTVGLELALRALNIGQGDEVIIPDYTYPATASAIDIVGAKIVIVDVDRESMLLDFEALEKAITAKTKAIIPVSIFGNPLDYKRLSRIKQKYNLYIVEDAACAIGAEYNGVKVGNLADISVFSLHPRKLITTGEGGIITTNNDKWADWMTSYKHFGMASNRDRIEVNFERIGTNYKLSNLQAAVGLVQMNYIKKLLAKRAQFASRYYEMLAGCPTVVFPRSTPNGTHSWQSCCIFVDQPRDVIKILKQNGIESQIGTYALHVHGAYFDNPNCRIFGDMAGSQFAFDHCLTLPLFHEMTDDEQAYVVRQLVSAINR